MIKYLEKLPSCSAPLHYLLQHCKCTQTDSVKFHANKPHVSICMWVWLVDVGHAWLFLSTPPTLSSYFLPVHPYTFFEIL